MDPLSRRRFWRLIDELSRAGVAVLVTTHYLDEAEHCHRVAIIQAGKLAALGTVDELKSIFASRPIFEVRAPRPVDAMQALDRMPEVEKTSIFGTAVHAVMRSGDADAGGAGRPAASRRHRGRRLRARDAVARGRVPRRGREGRAGGRVKFIGRVLAVTRKELRQISRDKRTLLILLFVPAFFLFVYGYALNFDIRNIALAVQDNDQSVQSRQLVSAFVRSGYFDLVAAVAGRPGGRAPARPRRRARRAGDSGPVRRQGVDRASAPPCRC